MYLTHRKQNEKEINALFPLVLFFSSVFAWSEATRRNKRHNKIRTTQRRIEWRRTRYTEYNEAEEKKNKWAKKLTNSWRMGKFISLNVRIAANICSSIGTQFTLSEERPPWLFFFGLCARERDRQCDDELFFSSSFVRPFCTRSRRTILFLLNAIRTPPIFFRCLSVVFCSSRRLSMNRTI